MDKRNILNEIYKPLIAKSDKLFNMLNAIYHKKVSLGFYNNHFYKNENGEYLPDYFPIPVVSIENFCDLEFDLDCISITTKLKKDDAIKLDYSKISKYIFEIYGVNEYLTDYYTENTDIYDALNKLKNSSESEFFYTFYFNHDTLEDKLSDVLKYLSDNKFYY